MSDEFIPSSSGSYALTSFYTASRDKRGFSDWCKLRVPPEIASQVAFLVASPDYPEYRTYQDFWRDAAIHRINYLAKNNDNPEFKAGVALCTAIAKVDSVEAQIAQKKDAIEKCSELANKACISDNQLDAHRALVACTAVLEALESENDKELVRNIIERIPQ